MIDEGESLLRIALRMALGGARPEWKVEAHRAMQQILTWGSGSEFTSEDVWPLIPPGCITPEKRAIGAIIRPYAMAGVIKDTGRTVKSTRPEAHKRPLTIWMVV